MKEKCSGDQTCAMAEDNFFFPMVTFTRAIGQTTNAMARAETSIKTGISMRVNLKMMHITALARILGSMEGNMLENIKKAKKTD